MKVEERGEVYIVETRERESRERREKNIERDRNKIWREKGSVEDGDAGRVG